MFPALVSLPGKLLCGTVKVCDVPICTYTHVQVHAHRDTDFWSRDPEVHCSLVSISFMVKCTGSLMCPVHMLEFGPWGRNAGIMKRGACIRWLSHRSPCPCGQSERDFFSAMQKLLFGEGRGQVCNPASWDVIKYLQGRDQNSHLSGALNFEGC